MDEREIHYGGSLWRNVPETYELEKPNPYQDKSTSMKAQDEMCMRHESRKPNPHQEKIAMTKIQGKMCPKDELRKLNPCQEKSIIVEAQDKMYSKRVSQKNLTRVKRNLLR